MQRYLSWLFIGRLLVILFAMVMLISVLDALGSADLLPAGAGFGGRLRYMALRLPAIFDRIFVLAMLFALLLTFVSLIRRNELVALVGVGISAFGLVRALAPAVLAVSVLSTIVLDQAGPEAKRALVDWLSKDPSMLGGGAPRALWLSDGRFLVEIERLEGEQLLGLTLFERDEAGHVTAVTMAVSAEPAANGWSLHDTTQRRFDDAEAPPRQFWPSGQTPESLKKLRTPPRDLGLGDLFALTQMHGSGSRPSDAYRVWAWHRLAMPLTGLGLLLLAVPLMQRFARRDTGEKALAIGLLLGFVYLLADGILKTLAESGTLGPYTAVFGPIAGLYLLGFWLLLGREKPS